METLRPDCNSQTENKAQGKSQGGAQGTQKKPVKVDIGGIAKHEHSTEKQALGSVQLASFRLRTDDGQGTSLNSK